MKRTNCWSPKGKVWFQKNDDSVDLDKIKEQEDRRFAKERRKENNSEEGKQLMRDIAFKGYRRRQ